MVEGACIARAARLAPVWRWAWPARPILGRPVMLGSLLVAAASRAWVALDKVLVSDTLSVGEWTWVKYTVYNLGDEIVEDAHLDEIGIAEELWEFEKKEGHAQWEQIGPGQNVSYMLRLRPRTAGKLVERLNQARLRYRADGEEHTVWSSSVYLIDVKQTRSIGAATSLPAYFLVVSLAAFLIVGPYVMWRRAEAAGQMPARHKKSG